MNKELRHRLFELVHIKVSGDFHREDESQVNCKTQRQVWPI